MNRDAWFWRVKAAQRDLIARCGGVRRAAEIAGCSPSWIGKCNSPEEDGFLSMTQKRALETDAQFPVVSKVEVEAQGWSLHQMEAAPAAADLHGSTARVIVEASDVMRVYAEAAKDGKLTPTEIRELQGEFAALARVLEDARLAGAATLAIHSGSGNV